MAQYSFSVKNYGRDGKSILSRAAYRSGTQLRDDELGLKTKSYAYKQNEVVYSHIFLPDNAPREYANRETLWNAVAKKEQQKNARLAREYLGAIPNEFSLDQAIELVNDFCEALRQDGICVDANIHWKKGNKHFHALGTTRPLNPDGTWAAKESKVFANSRDKKGRPIYDPKLPSYDPKQPKETNKYRIPVIDPKTKEQKRNKQGRLQWERVHIANGCDWNTAAKIVEWRKAWETCVNRALAKAGINERVDCRSLANRGELYLPTIHLGPKATAMERRHIKTDRGDYNRAIKTYNKEVEAYYKLMDELQKAKKDLSNIEAAERKISLLEKTGERLLNKRKELKTQGDRLYNDAFWGKHAWKNEPKGIFDKVSGKTKKWRKERQTIVKKMEATEAAENKASCIYDKLGEQIKDARWTLAVRNPPEEIKQKSRNRSGAISLSLSHNNESDDKGMNKNRALMSNAAKEEEENKHIFRSL